MVREIFLEVGRAASWFAAGAGGLGVGRTLLAEAVPAIDGLGGPIGATIAGLLGLAVIRLVDGWLAYQRARAERESKSEDLRSRISGLESRIESLRRTVAMLSSELEAWRKNRAPLADSVIRKAHKDAASDPERYISDASAHVDP